MKNIFLSLVVILAFYKPSSAQEIKYFNGSWKEIKAKARSENKYIFIDAYTEWCSWCKVMDKETMKDPKVIEFMSANYIAVKMDMEHGEGLKLGMKYHITGYPSFMFFNSGGEYVYFSVGYQKAADFQEMLHNSMDKSKQFHVPGYSNSPDVDYPEIYQEAFGENGKRKFPKKEEVIAYLDGQEDLLSEKNWAVISRFNAGDKYNNFFLDNIEKYRELYGNAGVNNKLENILHVYLAESVKAKDEAGLQKIFSLIDKYITDDPLSKKIFFAINFYKETDNWPKYGLAVDKYIAKNGYLSPDYINALSWDVYEKCDDLPCLKKAVGWMAKTVEKEPKYANLDTYAALLYKTHNYKDAETWAQKAIEEGKKSNEKVESTEELLEKIKKAQGGK